MCVESPPPPATIAVSNDLEEEYILDLSTFEFPAWTREIVSDIDPMREDLMFFLL